MSLAVDENRLSELARKTLDKSGDLFYQAVVSRTNDFLERTALKAEDFQAAESMCTSDNLILLSRYYAGEIIKPKKRTRRHTLYDQVMQILYGSDDAVVQTLNIIFLAALVEEAHDECETRASEEFWAQLDAYENPADADMWTRRADAMFLAMESWDTAAEAAKEKDWKSLVNAISHLRQKCMFP